MTTSCKQSDRRSLELTGGDRRDGVSEAQADGDGWMQIYDALEAPSSSALDEVLDDLRPEGTAATPKVCQMSTGSRREVCRVVPGYPLLSRVVPASDAASHATAPSPLAPANVCIDDSPVIEDRHARFPARLSPKMFGLKIEQRGGGCPLGERTYVPARARVACQQTSDQVSPSPLQLVQTDVRRIARR